MEATKPSCCTTKINPPVQVKSYKFGGFLSFISTVFLILVPKCPFCVMAYTGAILMFFDIEHSALFPYLLHAKPILGLTITLLIAFNYRGKKTIISLLISGLALLLLVLANYWYINLFSEWILYAAFFFAAWYNGNFQYFFRFIQRFRKKETNLG